MDDDERRYGDDDARSEAAEARFKRAKAKRHATAWDEPPDFYDDDKDGPP